jgi:hypothetical protein
VVTGLREGGDVKGCPLAAIMILDYGYKMHTYMSYAKHLCMYQSSGQQHALQWEFRLIARSEGALFTPGNFAGLLW